MITKKSICMSALVFIVGIVYGFIINLSIGCNISKCIFQSVILAIYSFIFYRIITLAIGFLNIEKKLSKKHKTELSAFTILVMMLSFTLFTARNNYVRYSYEWVYLANIAYTVCVFMKAVYDGRKIEKENAK